jgi:long-chain acyl-CoA synthetase
VSQQPEPLLGLLDADAARPALICPDADVRLSHAELAELVDGLAAKLQAAGVGPGDRVAVVLPNGVELVAILFALASLGARRRPSSD